MKLFVDTEWYDMIQDLPRDKQIEIMTAILAYPNGNSDTSVWQKVIRPKLDKSATLYTEKAQRLAENRKKRWHQTSEQISEQKSKQISEQKSNRYHDEEEDEKENVNENEDEKVINNPRNNTSGLTTARETKKRYGEFQKVKLTGDEHEKLTALYGTRLDTAIDKLDNYLAQKKKDPYASHYAVMKRNGWVYNEVFDDKGEPTGPKIIGGANA